jgi:hypothetical protein
MNKELLKEALDAIEGLFYGHDGLDREKVILTVEKIEKELINPDPDPVAIFHGKRLFPEGTNEFFGDLLVDNLEEGSKLYTSPQKREPLSNKQMQNVLDEWLKIPTYSAPIDLIRLTEKAHGIGE